MAYVDEFGITHSVSNSFPVLVGRLFQDPIGIIVTFAPLLILVIIFFLIRRANKKYLIPYSIIAGIIWMLYFFIRTSIFYRAA